MYTNITAITKDATNLINFNEVKQVIQIKEDHHQQDMARKPEINLEHCEYQQHGFKTTEDSPSLFSKDIYLNLNIKTELEYEEVNVKGECHPTLQPLVSVNIKTEEIDINEECPSLNRDDLRHIVNIKTDIKDEPRSLFDYSCPICSEKYNEEQGLRTHLLTHARPATVYECDVCPVSFDKKFKLNAHMKIHTGGKPFQCDLCFKRFVHKGHIKLHMEIHRYGTVKPYKCNICPSQFSHEPTLKIHKRKCHKDMRECDICHEQFSDMRDYVQHQRIHLRDKPYACDICDKLYKTKQGRSLHIRRHKRSQ